MKAKISSRISRIDRTKLEEVIPLRTPLLVFLDPSSLCNFQCIFCPLGNRQKAKESGRKRTFMSFEHYKKIIDDMTGFPDKIKTLRLYKDGEPLINSRLPDMIRYAKEKNVAQNIDLTTNGSLLTYDLGEALVNAGLDRIIISVEALSSKEYFEISKYKVDFRQYVDNIRHLYENKGSMTILIKITDVGVKGRDQEFYDIFGDICDEISIDQITPVWPEYQIDEKIKTSFDKDVYGQALISSVEVCPYIFYSMSINANGTVSACFVDWEQKIILGDAFSDSIVDIWNSTKHKALQLAHLEQKRSGLAVCENCGQLQYGSPDNIDSYKEELLSRLLS